jgi:hypothetical protein
VTERVSTGNQPAGNHPAAERQPTGDVAARGRRSLVAVIVLTAVVLLFAAALAFWMYWLQG